jgi:pimeloyl-ACP methyl ester carboxylesterase
MKKRNLALGIGGAIGAAVAVKLLTRPETMSMRGFAENVHHSYHSDFVEVDGATIHFQEFGNPTHPTLILVHGYTASTYVWKTVAPMFAERGFHVIAPDLIGFGYSDKPAWFDYTIQSQARMIVRFMNVLGIGQATLVGSSYGGAVSSIVTLDYPERVKKLVLVNAVINDHQKEHPLMKLGSVRGIGEAMTPFLLDSRFLIRSRMKQTFSPENQHLITEERVESVRRPLSAADGHNAVLQTARNWDADRIEEDAQLIEQPTLIIWGEDDTVVSIGNGYKMHKSILNSRFVVFRNCGHLPSEEAPENFVEIVTEFCNDPKGRFQLTDNQQMRLEPTQKYEK